MTRISFRQPDGTTSSFEASAGMSLMEVAVINGVDGIIGECGGQAICATCHVYVGPESGGSLPPIDDSEEEMLESMVGERREGSRLGCQIIVASTTEDLAVDIPVDQR
jgi:2Fe-2S ferredoxin